MKILLVNKFHYNKGGSETYYFALDEILRAHGHTVIHFAMQDERNFESDTSEYFIENVDLNSTGGIVEKIKVAKNMFYSREAYVKMKKLLDKESPDIVHIGLVHKQITYSIIDAIKEYNIPVIQSVHDLIFVCPCYTMLTGDGNCEDCIDKGIFSCIKKKCVKGSVAKSTLAVMENRYIAIKRYYDKIDLFITECNFYKEILEKSYFTNSRIVNIPNFLPPSKKMELRTNNGEYLLFFGRFSQEKGIITLLRAYSMAQIDTPLVLVGGGPIDNEVREFVKVQNLQDKVRLVGYAYGEELERLLCEAKAVIVPSEWYENCPYSILESMGKSRIVIASNIAGLPELVKDGETGFLFEAGSAEDLSQKITKLENLDEHSYVSMCKKTYDFAKETFSPDKYYEKIIMLYKELIDQRR